MIGKVIEKYEIKAEIGRGGMGIVYRGHQTNLNRDVAIKVLPPHLAADQQSVDRFVHEANLVAKLNHENIVQIYDIIMHEGSYFIIMEYLDGFPLDKIIRKGLMKITPEEYLTFIQKVCAALQRTHERGIIHRDVKAANIFITHDKKVKLMDFGISKVSKSTVTTGMAYGTPTYMSPEQAQAKPLDGRSDIYSLGVVLYECMTGRVPFSGDDAFAVALKHVNEQPVPPSQINPTIPPYVNRCIMISMSKDRELRFRSCDDFARALDGHMPEYLSTSTPAMEKVHSFLHDVFEDRTFLPGMTVISLLVSLLMLQQVPASPLAAVLGAPLAPVQPPPQPVVVKAPQPPPVEPPEPPPEPEVNYESLLQQVAIHIAARHFDEAQRMLDTVKEGLPNHPSIPDLQQEIKLHRDTYRLQQEVNQHLERQELDAALEKLGRLSLMHPQDNLISKLYDEVAQRKADVQQREKRLVQLRRLKQDGDATTLKNTAEEFLMQFPGDKEAVAMLAFAEKMMEAQLQKEEVRKFLVLAEAARERGNLEESRGWVEKGLELAPANAELLKLQASLNGLLAKREAQLSLQSEQKQIRDYLHQLSQSLNSQDSARYLDLLDASNTELLRSERQSINNLFALVYSLNSSVSILKISVEDDMAEAALNWKTDAQFIEEGDYHTLFNRQVHIHFKKLGETWKIGGMTWLE